MILIDGTVDFAGGQNSGLTSDRIAKNQYYKGVNVSSKNGSLAPRDRFVHIPIQVTTKGVELGVSYQEIFDRGKFQGERTFMQDLQSYVISVRSGVIFSIDLQRGTATVLRTTTDDRISRYHRRVNITQAGKYMVIFDWPNQPVIIRDSAARRSNFYAVDNQGLPAPEIPQSRLGVFLQNRLWVANGTNEFTAGDPVGDLSAVKAPITFNEVYTPNAPYVNQAFNLGYGFGNIEITAMGFISSRNSQSKIQATNYGPLYVATRKSVSIYDAELPRSDWVNTTFGRLELWGTGIVGQRAHTIIGSDILFQDIFGRIHSLTKNQNDERSGWATTNISREVYNWLNTVNKDYLDIGFITYHNNRVYIGARPYKTPVATYFGQNVYDYAHAGMVVLELDNASTIAGAAAPAWAGLWTGVNPMEVTSVDNKLYVTSKDVDGFNRTYLMSEEATYDEWQGIKHSPRSRIYMRTYDHEQPFIDKIEHSAEVSIAHVRHPLTVKLLRKPLHLSKWAEWNTFKFDPVCPIGEDPEDCNGFAPATSAGFKALPFNEAKETVCDTLTGQDGQSYRETQLLLDIKGVDWEVFKVKLKSRVDGEPEADGQLCDITNNILPKEDCTFESDWTIDSVVPVPGK